jgi:hypothetical protein
MIDTSPDAVVFAGDGGRVVFEISEYERPGAPDYHDANWLRASVSISAGAFSGSFGVAFGTYEFVELLRQLRQGMDALSGVISFENMERDLRLQIEFTQHGKARISGDAKPNSSPAGSLAFAFETDQSYLSGTVEALSAVVRRFPVKTK